MDRFYYAIVNMDSQYLIEHGLSKSVSTIWSRFDAIFGRNTYDVDWTRDQSPSGISTGISMHSRGQPLLMGRLWWNSKRKL